MFNKLNSRQLVLASIWLVMLWTSAAATETYRIVRTETTAVTTHLKRTVATVQVGANPLNRFLIHRVAKNAPSESLRGSILLLPPLGSAPLDAACAMPLRICPTACVSPRSLTPAPIQRST